jgi:hypothetical protein
MQIATDQYETVCHLTKANSSGTVAAMNNPDNSEYNHHAEASDRPSKDESTESPPSSARLTLKPQEIPLDHPDSCNMFQPGAKPFLATPAAIEAFGIETILRCLTTLQVKAQLHKGLDYLQVFTAEDGRKLWFIEDGEGGAITALLPEDY